MFSVPIQRKRARFALAPISVICALLLSACGGSSNTISPNNEPKILLTGKTSFVSADRVNSGAITLGASALDDRIPTTASSNTTVDSRNVVQGDIYRVFDNGRYLLNLNPNRGLQIVDLKDVSKPAVIGQIAMSGTPVEMYTVNNRAYILMNNLTEYQSVTSGGQASFVPTRGAFILTVDISQMQAPKVVDKVRVGDYFAASRLSTARSNGLTKNALYVASQTFSNQRTNTIVQSFSVDPQGKLQPITSFNLNGNALAVQASGDYLLVANGVFEDYKNYSDINVIDIASPDGNMLQGGAVRVTGSVRQKQNLHVRGKNLRVVSTENSSFSDVIQLQANSNTIVTNTSVRTNHVGSFDITDIRTLKPIDHQTFGDGQQLFATYFMDDRAFFVTYLRQDPFHAFSISNEGKLNQENEFIVSGWNDFFVPVQNNTRLVGIGHNDANNRRNMAISLYDVTNLKNKEPLIVRAELDLSNSWSEASWDDRAFSVLENATNVLAADGKTRETGLILLPFSSWDSTSYTYQSGVQIFSFSGSTVTKRGVMQQDSMVTRSFVTNTAAPIGTNLTALNLSRAELSLFDVNNPQIPNFKSRLELSPNFAQFITINTGLGTVGARYKSSDFSWWGSQANAKREETVELFPLTNDTQVESQTAVARLKVPAGSKMYQVAGRLVLVSSENQASKVVTTVRVYDLTNLASPQLLSQFVSDQISLPMYYYMADMAICGWASCGIQSPEVKVVGNKLVFVGQSYEPASANTTANPPQYNINYSFQVLNLNDPRKPVLQDTLRMNKDEDSVGVVVQDNRLWVNYKKSLGSTNNNGEAMAKYFIKPLDISSTGQASFGKEVNVPGQLMAIKDNQLYCLEYNWQSKMQEPSLHYLILQNDLAYLQASFSLKGNWTNKVVVEGGLVYVGGYQETRGYEVLTLQVDNNSFTSLSTINTGAYLDLHAVIGSKLVINAGDAYLVYDMSNPKQALPQAYYASYAWGSQFSSFNKQVYSAAGPYGIVQFSVDAKNL